MPRKVDAHWGDDGFHDPEPFVITDTGARGLLDLLDIDAEDALCEAFKRDVEEIGSQFKNWHKRGPSKFSRAEARKALVDLLRYNRIGHAELTLLNGRAFDYFLNELTIIGAPWDGEDETIFEALIADRIPEDLLRTVIQSAIDFIDKQKGPNREAEIAWVVAELCRVFETYTGRQATHSNKGELLAYETGPQSAAGKFAQSCMALIAPDIGKTQISTAMRRYIGKRRIRGN